MTKKTIRLDREHARRARVAERARARANKSAERSMAEHAYTRTLNNNR